jgi:diguanylate cyclase (GGDEF)-like protein
MKQKFNLLTILGLFLLGCLLMLLASHWQYHQSLENITSNTSARVEQRADWQYALYIKDKALIKSQLEELYSSSAITGAAIYSWNGDVLAHRNVEETDFASPPRLKTLRDNTSVASVGVGVIDEGVIQESTAFWSALSGSDQLLHLSTPIITTVNVGEKGLGATDFLRGSNITTSSSRRILGYSYLKIDPRELLRSTLPPVLQIMAVYVALGFLGVFIIFLFTRSVRSSMDQLHEIADGIASGKSAKELSLSKNSDLQPITDAINSILKNLDSAKHEAKVDGNLMRMKVHESESRLEEQSGELDKVSEEVRETKEKLLKTTYYDELTNLPNKNLFEEKLQTLLNSNERSKGKLALLHLHLSNFRRINDALGNAAGDLVLIEASKRLQDYLRLNDIVSHKGDETSQHDVARIGRDEFAIVLDNIESRESAGEVVSRLIEKLSEPIQAEEQEVILAPTVGIAVTPEHGSNIDELARAADLAMSKAEPGPNGGYLYFSEKLASTEQEDMQFEAHLRKAKEANQFQLHYQPQVDTVHGSIACVEALLRWEHPDLGRVPPGHFIPVAKELGMMEELSRWIIQASLRQLKDYRDTGLELPRVAVNLPADELNLELVNYIRDTLLQLELNPSSIELGLSNIVLMDENSKEYQALQNLSELGAYLSLDNFGISSTPLSHLNHYPLNELKLDRNIVRECNLSASKASLVRTVIAVADSLELNVVAEGVETEGEFHFLANNGARDMQGFLFSKPVSPEELRRQLEIPWFYMSQIEEMKRLQVNG